MIASKTFFEQIPTETVKRIATEFPEKNTSENTEMPDEVRSPHESWREVAQKVQQERDPQRTLELVEQLIATLDQEQLCKRLPHERNAGNRSE